MSNYYREDKQLVPDDIISEEDYQARIDICKACPSFVNTAIPKEYNFETEEYEDSDEVTVCKECNCQMLDKAWYGVVKCPLEKW